MTNRNYYHDYLAHHGVKGMKWGVRRYQNADGSLTEKGKKRQAKQQAMQQRQFANKVSSGWTKSYNKATDRMNEEHIPRINAKYKNDTFDDNFSTKRGQQYVKEFNDAWQKEYTKALLEDFGPEPISNGKDWVNNAPMMGMYSQWIKD